MSVIINPPVAGIGGGGVTYVVQGTGVAAADASALQAALNALPAAGGSIELQGTIDLSSQTIVVSKPTRFFGSGSSDAYAATNLNPGGGNGTQPPVYPNESNVTATTLVSASTTLPMFLVQSNGVSFYNVHFRNNAGAEPTAGCAIQLGGPSGFPANGAIIFGCSFWRFWINIDIVDSDAYTIKANKIIGHIKYGIRVNNVENFDEGDPSIEGNWIMSGKNSVHPDAAIYWQSGGGLKIIGNKISRMGATNAADIVRHRKAIWFQPPSGVNSGVMVITGNSIEAIDECAIFTDLGSNGGNCSIMQISGNEFNMSPLSLSGLAQNYVYRFVADVKIANIIHIGENVVNGCNRLLKSEYFDGHIGRHVLGGIDGTGPLLDIANGPNVSYDLEDIIISGRPANIVLLSDATANNYNSNSARNRVNLAYEREMPACSVGVATNLWRILIGNGQTAVSAKFEFEGTFSTSVGGVMQPYACSVQRVLSGNGTTATATLTPGTTDWTLAPGATTPSQQYLTWGFTNAGGYLTVSLTPTAGGTPSLNPTAFGGLVSGVCRVTINGRVREFMVY